MKKCNCESCREGGGGHQPPKSEKCANKKLLDTLMNQNLDNISHMNNQPVFSPSPASTEGWENRIWRWATNHAKGIHSDEFATLFEEIRSIRAQATEAGYQKGIKDGSK